MSVREAQMSLWGRGCKSCCCTGCQSDSHISESACKRKDANVTRVDCCDFGSGAENGKEELEKMN